MKHLHCWSVFEDFSEFPGDGPLGSRLSDLGVEGFELFTLVDPVPEKFIVPEVVSVHLPYAIDWRSAWEGRHYEGAPEDLTYFTFGYDRDEMVDTVHRMIDVASVVRPAYGVVHAGNTDLRQVLHKRHESDNLKVLSEFCELMNRAVSSFPGGEPPYTLAFENLWWEGLTLRDPREWELMERELEFSNWGFTLDTGHMLNTSDHASEEGEAIDELIRIVSEYPQEMRDRIVAMHVQMSLTSEFRSTIVSEGRGEGESWDSFMKRAFRRASEIDEHRPFSDPRIAEVVRIVDPGYVNHELLGSHSHDRYGDLRQQTSLFKSQRPDL